MQREIFLTRDGSHSVSVPEINVMYHSIHGAVQESQHVFIRSGLHAIRDVFPEGPINILEIGLGTGLNALLTLQEADDLRLPVHYTSLELFPLSNEEASVLNHTEQLNRPDLQSAFMNFHECDWDQDIQYSPFFTFHKKKIDLADFSSPASFHLIYFDAFAPTAQPELWTSGVFEQLYHATLPGGMLVTYCSKAVVRKAMMAAGWTVKKIQGPWGKREMVRAIKLRE